MPNIKEEKNKKNPTAAERPSVGCHVGNWISSRFFFYQEKEKHFRIIIANDRFIGDFFNSKLLTGKVQPS